MSDIFGRDSQKLDDQDFKSLFDDTQKLIDHLNAKLGDLVARATILHKATAGYESVEIKPSPVSAPNVTKIVQSDPRKSIRYDTTGCQVVVKDMVCPTCSNDFQKRESLAIAYFPNADPESEHIKYIRVSISHVVEYGYLLTRVPKTLCRIRCGDCANDVDAEMRSIKV